MAMVDLPRFDIRRVLCHRRDLILVAYALVVLALRVWAVVGGAGFSIVLFVGSVLAMPTLWAVKHNALHRPVFVHGHTDRAFLGVLSVLTGTASSWTTVVHCDVHHRHNNGQRDWTTVTQAPGFRWQAARIATYPAIVAARLWRERSRYLADNPAIARRVVGETVVVLTLVAIALVVSPVAALLYIVVPIVFGQWFLIAMNYLQHADGTVGAELEHSVNDTGRIFNFVLLNLGYHAAHHLNPGAHWSALPDLHRRYVADEVDGRFNRPDFARRLVGDVVLRVDP
ncbi:MAG: fatty acid desaturase family protein [Acidimicrobiales bacterium]